MFTFPTELHEKTAFEINEYFKKIDDVKAILLTCSCARGKATKDSCLDMAILLSPKINRRKKNEITEGWNEELQNKLHYKELGKVGKYSHIDLEFIDGKFKEGYHEWTSGPDEFELEIGNFIAYSKPLYQKDEYFDELKSIWLPYYDDSRRSKRLEMVKMYCLNNLHHIPLYVERQLYFQSFNRLYDAIGEFLQALFISERKYPISYDKWIKEQLVDILNFPNLYDELLKMMEYNKIESEEHIEKAKRLESLLSEYCNE